MRDFAEANQVPVLRFAKDERKIDRVRPLLEEAEAAGRDRVVAIAVAQEFQRVFTATKGENGHGAVWFELYKSDRRVTCYYFYVWDRDFGPGFIKLCAYFPYPGKVWANGHEWAKQQARHAAIDFEPLSNGFAACTDPAALQEICDRLGHRHIQVFIERWLSRLPHRRPRPRVLRSRGRRQPRRRPAIERGDRVQGKPERPQSQPAHRRLPQRHRPQRRGRGGQRVLETLPDQAVPQRRARVAHRDRRERSTRPGRQSPPREPRKLQAKARTANHRLLETERAGQNTVLESPAFARISQPTVEDGGQRAPALRFGDPRVMGLAAALASTVHTITGTFTNKSLRAMVNTLSTIDYTSARASYDLRRPRLKGLIHRGPRDPDTPYEPLHRPGPTTGSLTRDDENLPQTTRSQTPKGLG